MTSKRSPIRRIFFGIWHFIDGTRKFLLNLVFFLFLYFLVLALIDTDETLIVQPNTALMLRPYGDVVEQFSGTPLDLVLQQAAEQERSETRLRDLVAAIRRASNDDRITSLVIDPGSMWRIGMSSLLEIEQAIAEFKSSGKPVIALADNLTQQQYYLAALADEVWLNPEGMVWIDGFSAYRQFYREGLDKLEVEINLFRVGEYKSAMEPFVRDDMSPESKESNLYWIGSLWQQYLEGISRNRGVPLENLSLSINNFADRLSAVDGDFARLAVEMGLVDQLIDRPEANLALASMGAPGSGTEGFRQVSFENYVTLTDIKRRPASARKIAVVVAEGEIVGGKQPQGVVGSESLAEQLRQVASKSDIEAVVLRINSPGGETFASEKVRRELQALKETGKTVVASMGDVAASGGYWIAMGAEEVWASPSTITGSIGVFGILPTFSKPLEKLGVHTDGVGTTPLAGKLRLDRPLDPDLRKIFQHATEQTYHDFVDLVAKARGMDRQSVEEVARGRVWSGIQAEERGLVDHTGTLHEATDAAARIAGLGSDYAVEYLEREMTAFESMLIELTGSVLARFDTRLFSIPALRNTMLEELLNDLGILSRSSSGITVAAYCLCRVE